MIVEYIQQHLVVISIICVLLVLMLLHMRKKRRVKPVEATQDMEPENEDDAIEAQNSELVAALIDELDMPMD